MLRVALYTRLSQEDVNKIEAGDDSQSIQNQKSMLINYALEQDWEIFNVYSDDDYTGADRNRPDFIKLIDDAKNKRFDIILCKSQSRFTRELELVEKYLHGLFPVWGIRFISLVDNADTSNKANKKSRQINGLVNEWYLEDMSDNIRLTFKSKCKEGKHIGSFACYGYVKDTEVKGNIIIDPVAAKVIQKIFELYEQGNGQIKICQYLNNKGIPNPSTYKKLKGMKYKVGNAKGNTNWSPIAIKKILTNQMYIGNMVQHTKENISYKGKKQRRIPEEQWIIKEGTHEPIIPKEQFIKVQSLQKQKPRSQKNGVINTYTGLLRCMHCGSSMSTTTYKEYRYFRCRDRLVSKKCMGSTIRQDILDTLLLEEFTKLKNKYLNEDYVEQQLVIENQRDTTIHTLKEELKNIVISMEKNKSICKQLYMDKVRSIISEEEYVEFSKSFHDERKILEKSAKDLEEELSYWENQKIDIKSKRELIQQFMNLNTWDRKMITTLVFKIEIGKEDSKTGILPITVHWKF
jgi:DNA invertase Pin-like site-specific DNA recombinase